MSAHNTTQIVEITVKVSHRWDADDDDDVIAFYATQSQRNAYEWFVSAFHWSNGSLDKSMRWQHRRWPAAYNVVDAVNHQTNGIELESQRKWFVASRKREREAKFVENPLRKMNKPPFEKSQQQIAIKNRHYVKRTFGQSKERDWQRISMALSIILLLPSKWCTVGKWPDARY